MVKLGALDFLNFLCALVTHEIANYEHGSEIVQWHSPFKIQKFEPLTSQTRKLRYRFIIPLLLDVLLLLELSDALPVTRLFPERYSILPIKCKGSTWVYVSKQKPEGLSFFLSFSSLGYFPVVQPYLIHITHHKIFVYPVESRSPKMIFCTIRIFDVWGAILSLIRSLWEVHCLYIRRVQLPVVIIAYH